MRRTRARRRRNQISLLPFCGKGKCRREQKRTKREEGEAGKEVVAVVVIFFQPLPSLYLHAAFAEATLALAALPAASISSATAAAPSATALEAEEEAGGAEGAAAASGAEPLFGLGGGESALRAPPSACLSLLCALARAGPHRACGLSSQNLAVSSVA